VKFSIEAISSASVKKQEDPKINVTSTSNPYGLLNFAAPTSNSKRDLNKTNSTQAEVVGELSRDDLHDQSSNNGSLLIKDRNLNDLPGRKQSEFGINSNNSNTN